MCQSCGIRRNLVVSLMVERFRFSKGPERKLPWESRHRVDLFRIINSLQQNIVPMHSNSLV